MSTSTWHRMRPSQGDACSTSRRARSATGISTSRRIAFSASIRSATPPPRCGIQPAPSRVLSRCIWPSTSEGRRSAPPRSTCSSASGGWPGARIVAIRPPSQSTSTLPSPGMRAFVRASRVPLSPSDSRRHHRPSRGMAGPADPTIVRDQRKRTSRGGTERGVRERVQAPNFWHLGTINRDGSPHITPMWIDLEGDHVMFNTAIGRVKEENLRRDPRVSLSHIDGENPYTASRSAAASSGSSRARRPIAAWTGWR